MRKSICILFAFLALQCAAQTPGSPDPVQQELLSRIAALDKEVADLQSEIKSAKLSQLTISDGKTQASVVLKAADGKAVIQITDRDGKLIAEIGYSDWWDGPLLTIASGDAHTYVWAGASIPSKIDWTDLVTTAESNSQSYLSEKLIRTSLQAHTDWDYSLSKYVVSVFVDTAVQPTWNYYTGAGKFNLTDREVRAAFLEAGQTIRASVIGDRYKAVLSTGYAVRIYFSIKGYAVGTWEDGAMKLAGE